MVNTKGKPVLHFLAFSNNIFMFLHVRNLISEDSTSFDGFYAIYSTAFPTSEQKSMKALLTMLNDPSYTIFVILNDEKIVGFTIMYHPQNEDFFLLEYMAIDTTQRGVGLGSTLLKESLECLYKNYGVRALLIEIDSPEKASSEQIIRDKREQFYRRLGALKIDPFDYILPSQTSEEAPPMELLVLHPNMNKVSKKTLQTWLEKLYTNVYGCSRNDPRIAHMLDSVPPMLNLI